MYLLKRSFYVIFVLKVYFSETCVIFIPILVLDRNVPLPIFFEKKKTSIRVLDTPMIGIRSHRIMIVELLYVLVQVK